MNPAGFVLLGGLMMLASVGVVLWRGQRQQAVVRLLQDRLDGVRAGSVSEASRQTEPTALDSLRAATFASRLPRWFRVRFARADIEPGWRHLAAPPAAIAAAGLAIGHFVSPVVACVAVVLLAIATLMAFQFIAQRHLSRFIDDLPALFDLIKHLMLAGNSLQQGLVRAIDTSGPTIQAYLRPLGRRVQNGAPVSDSILWVADRFDVPELFIFGTAVETNARYGGRMSQTLGNLAQIVRDGARVRRELSAASAETRLSAIVLSLLPVGCGLAILVTNPSYMDFFVDTTEGHQLALFAVCLEVIGVLIMRRILRLEF